MPPIVIPLENASNLRDIGGWPTQDGRHVRTGMVFRAPALVGLSAADEAAIAALGLRTVCDLRGEREAALNPVRLAGAERLGLPIEPSVGAGLKDILRTGQVSGEVDTADMMALLRDAYCAYALQCHGQYRALFAAMLREGGTPLLLHCSAGKDRTGFGVALLLSALGVAWEDVVADYLATNRLWRRENVTFEMPDDVKDVLLSAHEPLLVAGFEALRAAYGSVEQYLVEAIGVDKATRRLMRDRFTT